MNAVFIFRFVENALEGRLTVAKNAVLTVIDAATGRLRNDIEAPQKAKNPIARLRKGVDGDCGKKKKNIEMFSRRNTAQ